MLPCIDSQGSDMPGNGLFQFKSLARLRDDDVVPAFLAKLTAVIFLCLQVAMHDECLLHLAWVLAAEVVNHLLVVAVAAESIDFEDFGQYGVFQAEDGNFVRLWLLQKFGAQCGGSAIADGEDAVVGVLDAVGDVVLDATGFHHARSGDDDAWLLAGVQCFRLVDVAHESQAVEAKRVGVVFDDVFHVVVEGVQVHTEHLGGVDGQGTVDEYGNLLGQFAFVVEVIQQIYNLLRAADRKRRDDKFAAFLDAGVVDDFQKLLFGVLAVAMEAVAVGGLGDDVVAVWEWFGRAQQVVVFAPDVARVADAGHLAAFIDFEDGAGAPEQVARVVELHLYVIVEVEVAVVGHGDEQFHAGACVFLGVDGLQCRQTFLAAFLVEPHHIVLLDEAAVGQHDAAQVFGAVGADDLPTEAQFVKVWNQAAVVDVSVGEDDIVDFFRVDHDVAVGGVGFQPLALEHATVQKDLLAVVGGDEVLAARHFLGRTDEFDFHFRDSEICPKSSKKK